MVSKIDMNFFNSCKNNELTQARKALYSGQVSSQNIVRCAGEVLLQHGNKGFVQECLAYLQSKRPNDPYAKALQVILLVQDKKYSEAFEMIKSGVPSITFDYLVGIAKKRVGTREQLEINGFLELCLDHIDLKNFYEDDEYRRELNTDGFHQYEESLGYFVNLALNCQRSDFVQGCLDEFDKNDILLMIQDDEQYSKYLKEVISDDRRRIYSYISHVGHNSMDLEARKKHLKRFVDTMMTLYPETFPVLLSRVVEPEYAYLLDVLEPELLHQAALHSQERSYNARKFSQSLNEERQLILLSKATGLPLKNAKGDGNNEDLKLLLSRLDQGKDGKLTFCQCIRELNSFTPSEREFYVALLTGDQEKALKLAKSGKVDIYKTLGNKTALMHAMDYGSDELISYLLRREGLNRDLKAYTKEELTTIYNLSGDKAKNGRPLIVYALEKAIKDKNFDTAKMLIAKGANLDLKDASGNSGYTILDANIENIVKKKGGIDFLKSIPNYSPIIPLLTDKRYKKELIEYMVSKGIDINTVCARTKRTALQTLLFESRFDFDEEKILPMFQDLLYLHPRDEKGVPIVQHATSLLGSAASHPRILKSLLAYGVDINTINDEGNTALAEALDDGFSSRAESLLVHGADSTHPSLDGDKMPERSLIRVHKNKGEFKDRPNEEFYIYKFSRLDRYYKHSSGWNYPELDVDREADGSVDINFRVDEKGRLQGVTYKRTQKEDRIVSTIMYGTVDEVKQLLSDPKSYSVNKMYYGYTPLMWAVLSDRADLVKMMLEHKPNLKIPSAADGNTILELAAIRKNPHMYKILNDYAQKSFGTEGVQGLVSQESENLQELIQAIKDGDLKSVKKITAKMPRLDIQDSQGNTPIKVACEMLASVAISDEKWCTREKMSDLYGIFCHLVEKGADVSYGSDEGPVMILCKALPDVKDRTGMPDDTNYLPKFMYLEACIQEAIKKNHRKCFIADSTGNTPLHYAIKAQSFSVMKALVDRYKYHIRKEENAPEQRRFYCVDMLKAENNAHLSPIDMIHDLLERGQITKEKDEFIFELCQEMLESYNYAEKNHPHWYNDRPSSEGRDIPVVSDKPYQRITELTEKDRDFQGLLERDGMYAKVDSTEQSFQVLKEINSENPDSFFLLMQAVENANIEFLDVLIQAGANVNQVDAEGVSPLDYVIHNLNEQASAEEKDLEYIEELKKMALLLKKAGAKESSKYPLSEEAKKLDGVAKIFETKAASRRNTQDDKEVLKKAFIMLIGEKGANLRAVDPEDKTPLLIKVIETGDADLVCNVVQSSTITAEALLEKGIDGWNAIEIAYQTGNPKIIEAMKETMVRTGVVLEDYKTTCLVLASAKEGSFEALEKISDKQKLDLRVQDQDGKTILHHLAEKGKVELLYQALLSQSNPDDFSALTFVDNNKKTPLDLLPDGDAKTKFVTDVLLKEVGKQSQNNTLITELLEQLDAKTLEELKKNVEVQGNETVLKLIDDKLTSTAPEVTGERTVAHETPVTTNIAARLAENSEQNITTIQGNDGVALSYTSSRGRA